MLDFQVEPTRSSLVCGSSWKPQGSVCPLTELPQSIPVVKMIWTLFPTLSTLLTHKTCSSFIYCISWHIRIIPGIRYRWIKDLKGRNSPDSLYCDFPSPNTQLWVTRPNKKVTLHNQALHMCAIAGWWGTMVDNQDLSQGWRILREPQKDILRINICMDACMRIYMLGREGSK